MPDATSAVAIQEKAEMLSPGAWTPLARRLAWLAAAGALVLAAGIAMSLASLQPGPLALQFAFTPQRFARIIHLWSEADLLRYRVHLPWDTLLLGCYGSFGYLFATRSVTLGAMPAVWRTVAASLLPLAAACDAAENALHWWLTAVPRFGVSWVYGMSTTCASVKWLLLFAFALLVLHAIGRRAD